MNRIFQPSITLEREESRSDLNTAHPNRAVERVQFGVFEADLKTGELRRSGVRVRVQSQPFKVLAALLEQPGEVVSRETLQQRLWGADTTVDFDHSLGIAINKLRDALGDQAENPRFVETLARRGYRFIAPVKVIKSGAAHAASIVEDQPAAAEQESKISNHPVWRWTSIGLALVCVLLMIGVDLRSPTRKPYRVMQVTHSGRLMSNEPDVESFAATVTDGTRLYFSQVEDGDLHLAVALAANGEMSSFRLPADVGAPLIGSLSPDGSRLLVHSHLQADPEQPLWIVPTLGGDAHRVSNLLVHDATWMPDGNRLLIANGNDLYVVGADGSDPHKLLTLPGLAFWLRWSPDGKRLRFTLRDSKRQTTELWEASADGSHAHPLLPGWSQPAGECCGTWTADGKSYVFQSRHNGHSEIWALRQGTWPFGEPRPYPITNGPLDYQAPSTSPAGHRLYFLGIDPRIELLRALPKSSAFAALGQNLSAAALAEYSGDGKWVAWLNAADGSLWRSRADGSERTQLTAPPLRVFSMKWSPDDKRLAVMGDEPGMPWKLYLVNVDGGIPLRLLNEDRNEADPDWTPDGQSIVFGRLPDRMDSRQPKAIFMLNLRTRQVTEIPGSDGLFSPRMSPDGRYIAAIRLDQRAMLLFDRETEHWSTLPTTDHGVGDPSWSSDSKNLYFQDFVEAGKPIYRIDVSDGHLATVATMSNLRPIAATDYRFIGLAPGDLPIVSAHMSAANLYSIDLDEQ